MKGIDCFGFEFDVGGVFEVWGKDFILGKVLFECFIDVDVLELFFGGLCLGDFLELWNCLVFFEWLLDCFGIFFDVDCVFDVWDEDLILCKLFI